MKMFIDGYKAANKKIVGGFLSVVLLVLCGVIVTTTSFSKKTTESQENLAIKESIKTESIEAESFKTKVNDSLSIIDKRLSQVQKEMEKNANNNGETQANDALKELSETILSFKHDAENSLLKSHEENEALAKKISALEEVITNLKGGEKKTQYLDKKALPFEVMAIDSVNEQAVAAIKYNYNHVALEKGERLAGWKVLSLDFSKQLAEFDDEKGAHVVLSLKDETREEKSWG